jgi:predicted permease
LESALNPVLGAAIPVFALVGCGFLAGRFRLIHAASSEALNRFVYAFALPAMLFIAVYRGSLAEILSGAFLAGVILATFGTALAGYAVSALFQGGNRSESVLRGLNASFANTGYLGIPLVTVAYGERAALPAALATVATNIVSFAVAIVCLELLAGQRGGLGRALAGVARSPLIWPIALAIFFVGLEIRIPLPVERFATLLAAAAGPCALFAIGLFVSQLSIREGFAASWPSAALKLALHPLLMAALAFYVMPIDAFWAKIGVVCASLPLGATAFVLAQRYQLLEAETSTGAVLSTAASVLTVSLVMSALA